jgi:hypothetical protein
MLTYAPLHNVYSAEAVQGVLEGLDFRSFRQGSGKRRMASFRYHLPRVPLEKS